MPKHGVGRSASPISVAAVALALVIGGGYVQPPAIQAASGNGAAKLSLPWSAGSSWRMTGGPHNHRGNANGPWSSVDFNGPRSGGSYKVRAARGGVVVRPCKNLVQIRHAKGWMTSYYHLTKIGVRAGERVARGQVLGYTSTRAGCGGSATGPHLHFTLLRYRRLVDLDGHAIGGWTVREGAKQYRGCLVRGDKQRCAPSGAVLNTGAIGAQ